MKLYLLRQHDNETWDTYDSVVVAAEDELQAKNIHPESGWEGVNNKWVHMTGYKYTSRTWANTPDQVEVEYIGEAKEGTEAGVILASFNAG